MAADLGPVAVDVVIIVFLSIALCNILELNVSGLTTFRRRSGLYFWSFIVATNGIAFNAVGFILRRTATMPAAAYSTFILLGWCAMVTGQSVVLYSRLHIVMHDGRRLRLVLAMIVTNAVWLHIPIIVLVYGSSVASDPAPFDRVYLVFEKMQLTVFCVQELIISGLYVYETTKLLRLEKTIGNTGTRRVMGHLIYVNIMVILLDFSVLGLEFANLYDIQTAWKPFVYSVKLKVEFSILNRLVELTRNARSGTHSASAYGRSGGNNPRTTQHSRAVALETFKSGGGGGGGGGGSSGGTLVARDSVQASLSHERVHDSRHPGYEVHVGKGCEARHHAGDTAVLMTTEIQIQSHSRRRGSGVASLAESGTEILAESKENGGRGVDEGSTSSVASDTYRYQGRGWQ